MKRKPAALCLSLLLASSLCPAPPAQTPPPPAAEFGAHPDEIVAGEGFAVVADRRMFAVMAFLNASGFDAESEGEPMHPVRLRVREMVAANLTAAPEARDRWKLLYAAWALPPWCYQDYALALNPDYPFRAVRAASELNYPKTAETLREFPQILNAFWITAKLDEVWAAVKPEYQLELKKYDLSRMKRELDFVWRYLRMPRRDSLYMVTVPNLLDERFSGIGARYGAAYYSVESPGAQRYGLNIHEYLHSVINGLVKASFEPSRTALRAYYLAGQPLPMAESYRDPVIFTYECLVRAIDHRIRWQLSADTAQRARLESRIADLSSQGLTLAQPFYTLLADYERGSQAFDRALPGILHSLPPYRPPEPK